MIHGVQGAESGGEGILLALVHLDKGDILGGRRMKHFEEQWRKAW